MSISYEAPESIEEVATILSLPVAEAETRVVEGFLGNWLAHTYLGRVRAAVCKKVEEVTKIARIKSADGKKYTETEAKYIERITTAEEGEEPTLAKEAFENLVKETVASLPFNLKGRTPGIGGGGKIGKNYWNALDGLFNDAEKLRRFVDNYLPDAELDIDYDDLSETSDEVREVLVRALKKALDDAAKNAFANL